MQPAGEPSIAWVWIPTGNFIRTYFKHSSGKHRQWDFPHQVAMLYKARHAHKRLYTVLPKYSKIQVLPGITSCRLVKDNKQAIELNNLLINNMPKDGYE